MEFIIFYFSGTGNTELIAKEIAGRLNIKEHLVELISIEDKEKIEHTNFENKIIGFGYPVYKFTFPDIFIDTFSFLNKKAGKNLYFQFSTYARFIADSFYDFSKKLNKSKFHLIAQECFKSPSCGISARKSREDFEYKSVMYFEDDIDQKLDSFIERILVNSKNKDVKVIQKHSLLNPLKLKIVKDIERTKYPKLQINREVCSMCGLCAKKCPDNNLVKQDEYIQIIDDEHCLHCLRCMNHCPSNAIKFGKLTIGENRYTLKLRDELFKKASTGHREKYWQDFEEIRLSWRKNTLKYWREHRKNPEV